ncbi:MAG: ATP-binding cassette domain-containing protein [Desulfococcaceae bacterium]|jgi:ABC-type multidrug transport system ATPase subunit|nr:ATP-binding cassette domain-containing protein [Desulfococcaceae bacterium]
MSVAHRKIKQKGDFEILLGSGGECDYAFTELQNQISPRHAALKRTGDRLFLRDLDSAQGTVINGKKIGSKWHEITLQDKVFLGKIPLDIGPTLLLGRDRVGLEAHRLYFTIPGKNVKDKSGEQGTARRILSNYINIHAEPGTLTAIMGPSGAGKTVLLNLMSGYLKPEKGKVMVGDFDVHKSFGLVKDIIAYVPQEDSLIPELTVHQSLHYCLQLGYPDMKSDVRQTLIETVLKRMGFSPKKLKEVLHTRIGSPEQRGLSGGERRRISIAHELVRTPLLLYLDEPTSGLSSVDSEHVVGLLRDICDTSQVTMLMTIHQPGKTIFDKLDNLLLMNMGGNVAYFGPAAEAVPYFEKLTGKSCGDSNPADYVLQILDNWDRELPPEKYFPGSEHKSIQSAEESAGKGDAGRSGSRVQRKHHHVIHQLGLLLKRNIQVKLTDRASLFLIFFQALMIAALLQFTFKDFRRDYSDSDLFAKTWFALQARYESEATYLNLAQLKEESIRRAEREKGLIGENSAQRRASILFLLIASAIWFGVINGSREIVSEKTTLKREAKGPLCLFSYLMAKICMLALIALIQTGILLLICAFLLDDIRDERFFRFWMTLCITAIAASGLSLFISASVKTEQTSLMIVPLLIIPQLFLGGLIRPVKFLSGTLLEQLHFSDLILQKWAFKALLIFDSPEVLIQKINMNDPDTLTYISFETQRMVSVFFGNATAPAPFLMIAFHALIPMILAYFCLVKKYS